MRLNRAVALVPFSLLLLGAVFLLVAGLALYASYGSDAAPADSVRVDDVSFQVPYGTPERPTAVLGGNFQAPAQGAQGAQGAQVAGAGLAATGLEAGVLAAGAGGLLLIGGLLIVWARRRTVSS